MDQISSRDFSRAGGEAGWDEPFAVRDDFVLQNPDGALFVGDLISFVAAVSLSGIAAAWIVFASPLPNSSRSGARMLIWFGLEGLLFLVGVAFQLSAGAAGSIFTRLDATTIGGAFIFAALLFRVGAPLDASVLMGPLVTAPEGPVPAPAVFGQLAGILGV